MKTTLEISDELFRQAKAVAALRGQSLKDLVTHAIKHQLEESTTIPKRQAMDQWLKEYQQLGEKIAAAWKEEESGVDLIHKMRR